MSALIDVSTGKAAMAYANEKPWHGLGSEMSPGQTLEEWQEAAGLNWEAKPAPAKYEVDGRKFIVPHKKVLYRSDTLNSLSVVSDRYQAVQPNQVVHFYDDLCDKYGYAVETMGALKGGRVIWALAKTGVGAKIQGVDEVQAYLLLTTSYDGTSATQARFTDVRVVCNNTLNMAMGAKSAKFVNIRHNTAFDANAVKDNLGVGEIWERHLESLTKLANVQVDPRTQVDFLLKVYHDLTVKDKKAESMVVQRTVRRLSAILTQAPGATMPTSFGTLYGLVNAVTYDVDHSPRARSADTRLASAWMGVGDTLKTKAFEEALKIAA